jgi:hypothetical protein
MTGSSIISTGEVESGLKLNQLNLIILSSFVDRDMLMRYHWGLGIGHTYSHTAASTDCQFRSISPWPQPPHSSRHMEDSGNHPGDETNESEDLADSTQTELDFELEFEPDSESSGSQSDSESVLGDHVDMYGWDNLNLDANGYYQF